MKLRLPPGLLAACLGCALLASPPFAPAQEEEEAEHAEERAEPRSRDRERDPAHHEREMDELVEKARDLQGQMMRMAREGRRDAAEDFRHLLQELLHDHPAVGRFLDGLNLPPDAPEHRIRHLFEAAEHLELAGFPEEAEEFRHRAEVMERELHEQRRHEAEHRGEGDPELRRQVRELQDMVRRLQDELRDLRADRPR